MITAHPADLEAVRAEYERLARRYDRRWAGYVRKSVRATLGRLPLAGSERLLDIGCGTGTLLHSLARRYPGLRLVGVDLCGPMVQAARRKTAGAVHYVIADAGRLPFAAGRFDVVVTSSAFHYWRDPGRCVAEMRRVLRPGGRLVVTDWCGDYWTCRLCEWGLRRLGRPVQRTYTSRECRGLLEAAGFRQIRLERYKIDLFWGLMTATALAPGAGAG